MVNRSVAMGLAIASLAGSACEERCEGFEIDPAFDCADGCGPPGTLLWARTHQGGIVSDVSELSVDACGAVVGTGSVSPDRTLGSDTTWTAKYGPDGRRAWTRTGRERSDQRSYALAVDASGGVVIGGEATDDGQTRAVLRAYDTHGVETWSRTVAGGGAVHELEADSEGGIVGMLDNGGLFRISRDGEMQWIVLDHGFGSLTELATSDDGRFAVIDRTPSRDPAGHVIAFTLSGEESWRAPTQDDPWELAFAPTGELFVLWDGPARLVGYDVDGRPRISVELESRFARPVHINAMTIDDGGDLLVAGSVDVDADPPGYAAWAAKLAIDGGVKWEWSIDRPGDSSCEAIAVDRDGAVFVTTRVDASVFSGTIDSDIWVGRLAP